jgi:hypothetical protein
MAGIVGQGTTFNLPNFVGDLFNITPSDTPLLSRIGGLTGGEQTDAKLFDWGFYDLRSPGDRTRVEGANAPSPEERVRSTGYNVVEIHQEAVEISYTKQAAVGQLGTGTSTRGDGNPVTDELGFQVDAALVQMALDIEWSFINQTFQNPADNTTPRKTRGLLAAIVTNVTDAAAGALTEAMVLDTMQDAWENGGLQEGETRTLITGAAGKRALTKIFITDKGYAESTRDVAGVNLSVIETDFGRVDIMLDRHMPADTIAIASLEDLAPVFLLIPGKGFLFVEELAKVGAAERRQLYGEVGLKSGNERKHAKIVNIA